MRLGIAALSLMGLLAVAIYPAAGDSPITLESQIRSPDDPRSPYSAPTTGFGYKIQRRTVRGVVKSIDAKKKALVLEVKEKKQTRDLHVDAGVVEISNGKKPAAFGDIHSGDELKVYGETTVQGGIRAMEITLPKARTSSKSAPEKTSRH